VRENTARQAKRGDPGTRVEEWTALFKRRLGGHALPQERTATFALGPPSPSTPTVKRTEIRNLDFFWQKIPSVGGLKGTSIETSPQDGIMIDQTYLDQTEDALTALSNAWEAITPSIADRAKFENLKQMARIATILRQIRNGYKYFDRFLETRRHDGNLRLDKNELDLILRADKNQEASHEASWVAELFYWQQSRVVPRPWVEKQHLVLSDVLEPLPLKHEHFYSSGAYSWVDKVSDLTTRPVTFYARKHQKAEPDSRKHIENEVEILRGLDHHHIVKYVKSYQRGSDEFAFLALPAADQNLTTMLTLFCSHAALRPTMRPALHKAFGCLSVAIQYLHNLNNIRHKDIKPDNILCHEDRFYIADFGLAYHFTPEKGSRTTNSPNGTGLYLAPEASSDAASHGRATDVFALGCAFLEILSALIYGPDNCGKSIRMCREYAANLDKVKAWIDKALLTTPGKREPEQSLLALSQNMINEEKHRPQIQEVITELRQIHDESRMALFCKRCIQEFPVQPQGQFTESSSLNSGHSKSSRLSIRSIKDKMKNLLSGREKGKGKGKGKEKEEVQKPSRRSHRY
jgi:serine/threonine protein kinase